MTLRLAPVALGPGVRAVFTGRDRDVVASVGHAGNLSHRRPHRPGRLASDRDAAAMAIGVPETAVVRLHQVHSAKVAIVDDGTPAGAELGPADAAVTRVRNRALTVLVADCVPVLAASAETVAVAHAGRQGVIDDVVGAMVAAIRADDLSPIAAVIGPAIRGCCYEVEDRLVALVGALHPAAVSETTWGTPSLDLPAAVRARLEALGVRVDDLGVCTHCDGDRWFSHRRDPDTGRQAGLVVRVQ